jgi:hypothetical protein
MITKNKLKERVKLNLDFVKQSYETNGDFHVMYLVQTTKKGEPKPLITSIMLQGNGIDEHKRDIIFDLGVRFGCQKLKEEIKDIDAIFMLAETWMSENTKVRPVNDPKHTEGLISVASCGLGDVLMDSYVMEKKWDDDKVSVKFNKLSSGFMKPESPLLDMFWHGVDFMDQFEKTLPTTLVKSVNFMGVEELYDMVSTQINNLREKNNGQNKIIGRESSRGGGKSE